MDFFVLFMLVYGIYAFTPSLAKVNDYELIFWLTTMFITDVTESGLVFVRFTGAEASDLQFSFSYLGWKKPT